MGEVNFTVHLDFKRIAFSVMKGGNRDHLGRLCITVRGMVGLTPGSSGRGKVINGSGQKAFCRKDAIGCMYERKR